MSRTLTLSALAALSLAGTAAAQDFAQFAVQTTTDGVIALSARAFEEGDYARAAELANQMATRPISPSRRSAAFANLCAAQSMLGNHEAAIAACESANGYRITWEAQNNLGAALYNAGRPQDAAAAFAYAGQIAPGEAAVQANLALVAQ